MNTIIRMIALVTLAAMSTVALAAEPTKIGVVNVPRLMQESPQAKAAGKIMEDEFSPVQREIVAQQNEFQAKQDKLQRDIDVMSAEERRNAERDLQNDQRNIQRRQAEFAEDVELRRNEIMGRMQQELLVEIQTYANKNGYDLVLGEGVYYIDSSLDITADILKALEARYKKAE